MTVIDIIALMQVLGLLMENCSPSFHTAIAQKVILNHSLNQEHCEKEGLKLADTDSLSVLCQYKNVFTYLT